MYTILKLLYSVDIDLNCLDMDAFIDTIVFGEHKQ